MRKRRRYGLSSRHLRRIVSQNVQTAPFLYPAQYSTIGIHTSTDSLQSTQQCNQVEDEDSNFASDCSEINLQPQHEDNHSTSDTFQQLHSAVGDHQETQSEKFDLSKELKSWASEGNISHVAVKRLLNILKKHPCHSNLPSDPRTLLETPKCVSNQFRVVKPGLYFHFGLEKQLTDIVNHLSTHSPIPQDLLIFVNVDGLPAAKSAGSELWPILGSLPQFTHVQPFEIGLYHGPKKPCGSNDYLKDFINEAAELENEGIVIGGRKINVSIAAFIADTPARSFITCTLGHTGYGSCFKCSHPGVRVRVKGSDRRVRRRQVAFSVEPGEPRTNETFRRHQDKGFHHCYSDLQKLKLDLIKKIPLDYLHLICFGVMKKLLMTWSGQDKVKFNRKARLRPLQREKISRLLHHLRQYTPLEFARRPRSLQELKKWKATEFRQFLLYTGPIVLKKILPEKHYKNFMKLHVAIKILATPKMCIDYNEVAQRLINFFVRDCKDLYGKRFICYNIHSLLHLPEDVMTFGHLDSFSTFPFENHLRLYKPMIRKGEFVLAQVVTRIMEMKSNHDVLKKKENLCELRKPRSRWDFGPMASGINGDEFKEAKIRNLTFKCYNSADNTAFLTDGTLVSLENFVRSGSDIFFIGRQLSTNINVNAYSYPIKSSDMFILLTSNEKTGPYTAWRPSQISCKAYVIPNMYNNSVRTPNTFTVFPMFGEE